MLEEMERGGSWKSIVTRDIAVRRQQMTPVAYVAAHSIDVNPQIWVGQAQL